MTMPWKCNPHPKGCMGNWMFTTEKPQKEVSFLHLGPTHLKMVQWCHIEQYVDVFIEEKKGTGKQVHVLFSQSHWKHAIWSRKQPNKDLSLSTIAATFTFSISILSIHITHTFTFSYALAMYVTTITHTNISMRLKRNGSINSTMKRNSVSTREYIDVSLLLVQRTLQAWGHKACLQIVLWSMPQSQAQICSAKALFYLSRTISSRNRKKTRILTFRTLAFNH